MSLSLRSLAAFVLTSALATVLFMPACSQQGEGERCDRTNGDSDCDSGLKCVAKSDLADVQTDRCCDPDQTTFTDKRCRPNTGTASPEPAGGAPGDGGPGTGGQPGGAGEATNGGAGGQPSVPTEAVAGAGGVPGSGGVPGMSEAGAPNGGMVSMPSAGQGGGD